MSANSGTGLTFQARDSVLTGYVLAQDAWGHGYATEALGAMVELAGRLGLAELAAWCHPDHRPSQRVLEKGGFARLRTITVAGAFPNLAGDPGDAFAYARAIPGLGSSNRNPE